MLKETIPIEGLVTSSYTNTPDYIVYTDRFPVWGKLRYFFPDEPFRR